MRKTERKELYDNVVRWFRENVPDAGTELDYDSPFHLLVAVILSAQCTDKRVNIVTPPLFEAYPGPADLAAASVVRRGGVRAGRAPCSGKASGGCPAVSSA